MLASIRTALSQRADKKSAYLSAIADYEAKAAAHKKVASTPGKESQVAAKEQSANNAKAAMDKAKEDFEKVSDRLLSEFDTFKAQKASDMKEILINFVQLQVSERNKLHSSFM